jgi:hypothetical protein
LDKTINTSLLVALFALGNSVAGFTIQSPWMFYGNLPVAVLCWAAWGYSVGRDAGPRQ